MTLEPWVTKNRRATQKPVYQRGRKTASKQLTLAQPPAPPAHLDEYARAVWRSIVQDERFHPTTANCATLCVAMEALAVIRHMGDRMRDIKKDVPRSVYEIHSRAIKSYCDALELLGVRNAR